MSDAATYQAIAFGAVGYIAGAATGLYLTLRYAKGGALAPAGMRGVYAWSRSDVDLAPVASKETFVRKDMTGEHPTDELVYFDGKTLTFSVETIAGQRDMTFKAREVYAFFRCDTPRRAEWRGDNNVYSQLTSVAKSYKWVYIDGNGITWANFLATHERRLRALRGWVEQ